MIIGLIGKKGSGKDFVASFLQNNLAIDNALSYWSIAFADKMKVMVAELLGIDVDNLHDQYYKENYYVDKVTFEVTKDHKEGREYRSIREFLQYFGTDVMQRGFGKKVWVTPIINTIKDLPKDDIILVTDVRFLSEYKALKSLDAIMIRVTNPEIEESNFHISETELDMLPSDYVVINNWKTEPDKVNKRLNELLKQIRDEYRFAKILQENPSRFENKEIQNATKR